MTSRTSLLLALALALGCGVRGLPKPPLQDPEPPPALPSDNSDASDAGR